MPYLAFVLNLLVAKNVVNVYKRNIAFDAKNI